MEHYCSGWKGPYRCWVEEEVGANGIFPAFEVGKDFLNRDLAGCRQFAHRRKTGRRDPVRRLNDARLV